MQTVSSRWLVRLVRLVTAGVAVQAVLAGQFISGLNNLVDAHEGVANGLGLASLLLILVAVADRRNRRDHRGRWLAALLLGVAVIVQAAFGYAPGALPTAIHVPFGVLLFAWSVTLSIALARTPAAARAVSA